MNEDQSERLVLAFERIATALGDIRDEVRRAGTRYWPQPKQQREAVVSKVESDEERDRKLQGARRRNISEVIDPDFDETIGDEFIGERTRQWHRDHPQEAKEKVNDASAGGGSSSGAGVVAIEDQA